MTEVDMEPPLPSKTRRRRFQFGLRTLFILVTACAVLLTVVGRPVTEYLRERSTIEQIEKLGGTVSYITKPAFGHGLLSMFSGGPSYRRAYVVTLEGTQVTTSDLQLLKKLPHLHSLSLAMTNVSDEAVETLASLQQLDDLNLTRTKVSYDGLARLDARLPNISYLVQRHAVAEFQFRQFGGFSGAARPELIRGVNIKNTSDAAMTILELLPAISEWRVHILPATDDTLEKLCKATHLTKLDFRCSKIKGPGLQHLASLKNLKTLKLNCPQLDDAGLTQLPTMPELEHLGIGLGQTVLSGKSLKQLPKKFPLLETLDLGGITKLIDGDLEVLKDLTELQTLNLVSAHISGNGLMHLARLPNFESVVVNIDHVDPEALQEFRLAAPHVDVQFGPIVQAGSSGLKAGHPRLVDADTIETEAFWSGDFKKLARRLTIKDGSINTLHDPRKTRSPWHNLCWLGHAQCLDGKIKQAVATYHQALDRLRIRVTRKIADSKIRGEAKLDLSTQALADSWGSLTLLVGQLEFEELGRPADAMKTLQMGTLFYPDGNQSIDNMAESLAALFADRKSPRAREQALSRSFSTGMYPMAAHQLLAHIYEDQGDTESALDCWTRLRLCELAYGTGRVNVDSVHVASLWSQLEPNRPLPAMPLFLVAEQNGQEIVLNPAEGQSRLASWNGNDWNTFAIVPTPGKAIAKLDLDCTVVKGQGANRGQLSCWLGGRDGKSYNPDRLLSYAWPNDLQPETHQQEFSVEVEHDAPILFIRIPWHVSSRLVDQIKIRVTLRDYGAGQALPPLEKSPPKIRTPNSPITSEVIELVFPGCDSIGLGDSACVALPDGSWLMAFTHPEEKYSRKDKPTDRPNVMFSTSRDGQTWNTPWPYEHNGIFGASRPSLVIDDAGTMWMLTVSQRISLHYRPGSYLLWLSSSSDGHNWSRPRPIRHSQPSHNPSSSHLRRDPGGRYWIFSRELAGSGDSPDLIECLKPLNLVNRAETGMSGAIFASFDNGGRCYMTSSLNHCFSDNMQTWSVPTTFATKGAGWVVGSSHLFVSDHRVSLISNLRGDFIRRGTISDDGLQLGEPIQFADGSINADGRFVIEKDGHTYLPVSGSPARLLKIKTSDLFEASGDP